jgi:hypothetical protein
MLHLYFNQQSSRWVAEYGDWFHVFNSSIPSRMLDEIYALGAEAPDALIPLIDLLARRS